MSTKESHNSLFETSSSLPLLGDYFFSRESFSDIDGILQAFSSEEFKGLTEKQRSERVNRTLLNLIEQMGEDVFLLPHVIDYIGRVCKENTLDTPYTFYQFEFWLNHFSGLSEDQNCHVRAKIAGKRLPRESYQSLFPIGMGKRYYGTHFVTAHISPDLDTTVASFWGWLDAFAARVGDGLHIWNLPGGEPPAQIASVFQEFFGDALFFQVAQPHSCLTLSAIDCVTQKGFIKKLAYELTSLIDHDRNQRAVILVDEEGGYIGDWRGSDVEGVRQVVILLNNCLRWFENNLQVRLISLFAKEELSIHDIPPFISSIFDLCIKDCEPAKEYNPDQKEKLQAYLCKVLGVRDGLESTFGEFGSIMDKLSLSEFSHFRAHLESLSSSELFDRTGYLRESRPMLFHRLEKVIKSLDEAIQSIRNYVDRLDIAMKIKSYVLNYETEYVNIRDDAEEIRTKMGLHHYLTVVSPDKENRLLPMGIILASDLYRSALGTVTLRDFCNKDEIKIAPYLEIISAIDHHRSHLQTAAVANVLSADVQSSNVLLAEQAFFLNDQYSLGGMTGESIESTLHEMDSYLDLASCRLKYRLMKRQIAALSRQNSFIHPKREFIEYLLFLHAILDDTDLLAKASYRDVECVASLLNRLKSLMVGKEVEVVSLGDIPRTREFVKLATKKLLQNPDLYSIYKKAYSLREQDVEQHLILCAKEEPSSLFADTKELNGCCRVGQTKLFVCNFPTFLEHADAIRQVWMKEAELISQEEPQIDFHLHMISTITGAEEAYLGHSLSYTHKDELWIWAPPREKAYDRLSSYLNAFKLAPELANNDLEVEYVGKDEFYSELFLRCFLNISKKMIERQKEEYSFAILRFKAGSLNSRKAMITPYIPTIR